MKKIVFIASFFISSAAFSGEEIGTVEFQHGQYGASASSAGKLFFFLEGSSKAGSPPCATSTGGERWVIDNNRPAAQLQNSILLAANLAGKKVKVSGDNTCSVHGDSENAIDVRIVE